MELITCPACGGLKIVEKTDSNGEVCCYADRTTIMRLPCEVCCGSGVTSKKRFDDYNAYETGKAQRSKSDA